MSNRKSETTSACEPLARRTVLAGAATALVVATVGLAGCDDTTAGPALGPVVAGAKVDQWTVIAVHPVHHGALPIVLETAGGHRYQVDVLARDPRGPAGVAETKNFSLYVANRGDGSSPTDESQGLGAMALAAALREHESSAKDLPELMTLRQRSDAHPDGAFGVPLT